MCRNYCCMHPWWGLSWNVCLLLGWKRTVYPAPLLTLYCFTNCSPATSSGVNASSSLYRVSSLAGPITLSGTGMVTSCTSTSTLGLILSPSSDPIPHWLVSRIQAGEFIEMCNLPADNISLHNQLEYFHGHIWPSAPTHFRPRLREVPSLSSWVYCTAFVRI